MQEQHLPQLVAEIKTESAVDENDKEKKKDEPKVPSEAKPAA